MERDYTIRDAAVILGIKVRTLRQWIHDGKINAYKRDFSRRWVIRESELRRVKDDRESGERN